MLLVFHMRVISPAILTFLAVAAVVSAASSAASTPRLSLLGEPPDWADLNVFQRTMTRAEFEERMKAVYAPHAHWRKWYAVSDEGVAAVMEQSRPEHRFFLEFLPEREEMGKLQEMERPLRVVLDPGHIGGEFAKLEQRWFQIGEDLPVAEGDLVLEVAHRLRKRLEELGCEVVLVRTDAEPVTSLRPADLRAEAEEVVRRRRPDLAPEDAGWEGAVESWQNLLFYRVSEIRARADIINHELRPNLVLALHINATAWPDAEEQTLAEEEHFHLLLNGAYMDEELALDDMRFHLLRKLLSREFEHELPWAEAMAASFAGHTGLPPFTYSGRNAVKIADNPYLWGRNLLANRLFHAPVLFLEPYVANSRQTYERIQEYLRAREAGEEPEDSILEEYVQAVVDGLIAAGLVGPEGP